VLHYVPYGKDSQQSAHKGFSPVPYPMVSDFVLRTLSLYIIFTMMSTTKFPRTNHTYSVLGSLKHSMDFCYVIWNKALYYMYSSFAELFVTLFTGLPAWFTRI
jgi:hypothetical protein